MKAIVYDQFGPSSVLQLKDVPEPEVHDNEVQIRLAYSGINPVDYKIRDGDFNGSYPHEFPIIPGWEGAGVVTKVGKGVRRAKVGDEVYGYFRMPLIKNGTYAEYIVVPEDLVVHIPETLTLKQAACVPLTALTAWQALFNFAKLQAHETVMVLGAAGGVGSMAVQMAAWAKGTVYATASSKNHPYILGLGAQKVFDYTQEDVQEALFKKEAHGVDVVFDCVGGDTAKEAFTLVKKGGRVVSIAEHDMQKLAPPGVEAGFIFVSPNRDELHEIGVLIDHKKIAIPPIAEFPLSEASKALDELKARHVQGKIVLKIT
ncbi:MAG: NADP-dependent oxidoreductase [Chlamydiales bacterium]|nr:NADP-dependent oxidoreductase [Chlamydiales bacterium]